MEGNQEGKERKEFGNVIVEGKIEITILVQRKIVYIDLKFTLVSTEFTLGHKSLRTHPYF